MVDFAETETHIRVKHKIIYNSGFQIHPGENEAPFEKQEYASVASQRRSNGNLSAVCDTFCLMEQKVQLASDPARLAVLGIMESVRNKLLVYKSAVFRIGTN